MSLPEGRLARTEKGVRRAPSPAAVPSNHNTSKSIDLFLEGHIINDYCKGNDDL